MAEQRSAIRLHCTDRPINDLLQDGSGRAASPSPVSPAFFNHAEERFLKLDLPLEVPSLPIHHDVEQPRPQPQYLERLRAVVAAVHELRPDLLAGLTYNFDPANVMRPAFFRLYRLQEMRYLLQLKLDLAPRSSGIEVLERGDNDRTARYRTTRLFVEPLLVPLAAVDVRDGQIHGFQPLQIISETWLGERGRGYFVQGMWMDDELSKFFSRLFVPEDRRLYPYLPFLCRYRTVSLQLLDTGERACRQLLPYLRRALDLLAPAMPAIQRALRGGAFDQQLPLFRKLQQRVPAGWREPWHHLRTRAYLNHDEMREFEVHLALP